MLALATLAVPLTQVAPRSAGDPSYPPVLQVSATGGYQASGEVTLWPDGRMVFSAGDGSWHDIRILAATVSDLVEQGRFLLDLEEHYAESEGFHGIWAGFGISTGGRRKRVEVYGFSSTPPCPWMGDSVTP